MDIRPISAQSQFDLHHKLYNSNNLPVKISFKGNKLISDTFIKEPLKRIANSEFGELPTSCQEAVREISKQMDFIKDFFAGLRSNPYKGISVKDNYPNFIRNPKKQGISFKYGEDGTVISILKNRNKDNLLRIFVEKSDDNVQNILIENSSKVITNLNEHNQFYLPKNNRYMTEKEIYEANIPAHIDFARKEVDKFTYYLKNYDTLFPPKRAKHSEKIEQLTKENKIVEKPLENLAPTIVEDLKHSADDLFLMFDIDKSQLSSHLSPIVSPSTNKVLGFNLNLENGSKLRVLKTVNPTYGNDLRYVAMVEILPDGSKKYLNVDMLTGKFLKTGFDGKPTIFKGESFVEFYEQPEDLSRYNIHERFNKYMDAIKSKNTENSEAFLDVTVLKQKSKSRIYKDVNISDLEDENLNNQLDEEYKNSISPKTHEFSLQSLKTFHLNKKKNK